MLLDCLFVGFGGFIGSILRYLLNLIRFEGIPFPLITLFINTVGSFAIMFIAGLFARELITDERLMLFLRVGLCGGFTTFSTFSAETLDLFNSGEHLAAFAYAILSVVLCVGGAWLGSLAASSLKMV